MQYPYSRPHVNDDDISEVMSVLRGQFLTQGSVVVRLEEALQNLFSVKHAIVCNSGTAALHMAYDGLGLGPDAGLITSAVTFLATANAARMSNAPVGLADVDPVTGNVTLATIKAAVEEASFKVRAIAVVHLGGRPCEMIAIGAYAKSIGAYLVEDACHAPLAEYTNGAGTPFKVGSCAHSDAATLSFHAIKHIAAGEGGVLLTNSDALANQARLFRSHGMVRDFSKLKNQENASAPWYYEMHELGYNYRLTDFQASLGIEQLKKSDLWVKKRRELVEIYDESFRSLENLKPQSRISGSLDSSYHLYIIQCEKRLELYNFLKENKINTQVHYIPIHLQPYYKKRYGYKKGDLPNSETYYEKALSLPLYPDLKEEEQQKVISTVRKFYESN